MCVSLWAEIFERTFANYALAVVVLFFYIPFVLLVKLWFIILMKLKMQAHPGEQSANAEEHHS